MKKMTFFSLIICAFALSVCFVNAQSKTASLNDEVVTDIDGNTYIHHRNHRHPDLAG